MATTRGRLSRERSGSGIRSRRSPRQHALHGPRHRPAAAHRHALGQAGLSVSTSSRWPGAGRERNLARASAIRTASRSSGHGCRVVLVAEVAADMNDHGGRRR
jgi:hypothetical protein